jgi:hypothetical protein
MQYTIHTVMLTGFISERHLWVEYVISEVYQVQWSGYIVLTPAVSNSEVLC